MDLSDRQKQITDLLSQHDPSYMPIPAFIVSPDSCLLAILTQEDLQDEPHDAQYLTIVRNLNKSERKLRHHTLIGRARAYAGFSSTKNVPIIRL